MAPSDTVVSSGGAGGTGEQPSAAQKLDGGGMERHRIGAGSPSPQSSTSTPRELTPAPETPEGGTLSGENMAIDSNENGVDSNEDGVDGDDEGSVSDVVTNQEEVFADADEEEATRNRNSDDMDVDSDRFPPPSSSMDVQPSISGLTGPLGPSAVPNDNGNPQHETDTVYSSSSMYLDLGEDAAEDHPVLGADALALLPVFVCMAGEWSVHDPARYPAVIEETVDELKG